MKKLNGVIRAQCLNTDTVESIFKTAEEMELMFKAGLCPTNLLSDKILISLFMNLAQEQD